MRRALLVPDLPIERWPSMDRYASRLTDHLRRIATDVQLTLAGDIGDLTIDRTQGTRDVRQSGPTPAPIIPDPGVAQVRRYIARYWSYPRKVRHMSTDLIHVLDHSYAHVLRAKPHVPSVVSVHDLMPVITLGRGGGGVRERVRNYFLATVLATLRRADAWIVSTEWLRGELATWLGHERQIHVIPYGVDDEFFAEPTPDIRPATRARWGIPANAHAVLHVGSVGQRKNIPALLAAVHGLRQGGTNAWILQVGGVFTPEQEADIRNRGLAPYTVRVGEAAESELRAAYHAADVLLFPSHYEGFGFPVLEAMASGLPVVTSGAGGLGELAGDAAVVVGGRDPGPYVVALRRLIKNDIWRAELIAKGKKRARNYRWLETARQTAAIYRSLVPA